LGTFSQASPLASKQLVPLGRVTTIVHEVPSTVEGVVRVKRLEPVR
jgi:hypothetical protein